MFEVVKTTILIFFERRFTTAVERNESSVTKYYSSEKEAEINKFEQEYLGLIEVLAFEENRLNMFSETIELDLWRQGFLTDNRKLYSSIVTELKPSDFAEETIPDLILDENNGQKSLEGLLHRNEIGNPSLILKLKQLLSLNEKLIILVEDYLVQ